MSEERRKVLELLAAGTITPVDAERLLEKLAASEPASARPHKDSIHAAIDDVHAALEDVGEVAKGIGTTVLGWQWPNRHKAKFLRIEVTDGDGEDVNIRLPMGLLRTGLKISTIVPVRVNAKLREQGVDLSSLGDMNDGDLDDHLRDLNLDVHGPNGERVRVYCE